MHNGIVFLYRHYIITPSNTSTAIGYFLHTTERIEKYSRVYSETNWQKSTGVGNRLGTDTFLPIVQGDTVSVGVVAALMHQPPHFAVLAVIHDGDRLSLVVLHSDSFHIHHSRGSAEPPGGCPYLPVPAAPAEGADGYSGGS